MSQEKGLVASIKEDGWAQVVAERRDACGDCGASKCCTSMSTGSKMVIKALNSAGAGVGDLVFINISSGTVLKGAAIFYMIPVIGLIAGTALGGSLNHRLPISETNAAILFGFAGLVLGFIIAAIISRRMSAGHTLSPVITRIIKPGAGTPSLLVATDPVCNMVVNPAEAPASVTYQDRTYYFCHQGCKESFQKEPDKYL